uniref:Fimbrin n=2 Tax=Solanum TaxID=4107 RepID=M1BSA2_SOLTU
MMLTLTASIMYWHLKQPMEDQISISDSDSSSVDTISTSTLDDTASECSMDDNSNR